MITLIFNFAIIGIVIGNVYKMIGASEKIVELMRYEPTVNSKGGAKPITQMEYGEIELKNVTFHYPSKPDVQVLKEINLKVEKNQVVALVGKSGCGKSSIISLVERFYE